MLTLDAATFLATDDKGNGTVELTLGKQTRRVRAYQRPGSVEITAYDVAGRYQTGGKVWPGYVSLCYDGRIECDFGRNDNHPKFNKAGALFFTGGEAL